ncbi:right-handed parallel beta-helix repeat-containing protein [Methylocapsa sp. S129]|uniref:right-handed parallel beta-helix repeat-containing protein n=1 Tax=Methylocapsa sp. S129 TaxID=1641869 RepID=UPI00131D0796|nr:right-handed parallel beta-helix repeat-containing protein [Methylocapsa sp. S129]
MIKPVPLSVLSGALFIAALATPAYAQANRAFVSGHGADAAGCGAPTSPCRSFQYVHDNIIAAGGEIDVLDPAGYGAITISKAISIVNDGVGTAGVQQAVSGQNAIIINAGTSDSVTLRGLNIDGLGVASVGILVEAAGSVTIANCVVRHFAGNAGIRAQPASGALTLLITDVTSSDNGGDGISIAPSGAAGVTGLIKRVTVANNLSEGIDVYGASTTGTVYMTAVDVAATGNRSTGFNIVADPSPNTTVFLDNVTANGNAIGLGVYDAAIAWVRRSSLTNNEYGAIVSVFGPGVAHSFQDNAVHGNTFDFDGAFTSTTLQ